MRNILIVLVLFIGCSAPVIQKTCPECPPQQTCPPQQVCPQVVCPPEKNCPALPQADNIKVAIIDMTRIIAEGIEPWIEHLATQSDIGKQYMADPTGKAYLLSSLKAQADIKVQHEIGSVYRDISTLYQIILDKRNLVVLYVDPTMGATLTGDLHFETIDVTEETLQRYLSTRK